MPVKSALVQMGLLATDTVRAPLLPIDAEGRAAMAVVLRDLGLVEVAGGRIVARSLAQTQAQTQEAVA